MLKTLAAALAALLLGGCVLSLGPFYSPESVIASPVPQGKWRRLSAGGTPETEDTWVFERDRVIVYDDRGQWRAFEAKYFRVGATTFVDTFPQDVGKEPPSEAFWLLHHVPFHIVSRIEVSADRMAVRTLAATKPFRDAARTSLAGRVVDRGEYAVFVLDATPADWKAFLEKHGNDEAVFGANGQIVFVRVKE